MAKRARDDSASSSAEWDEIASPDRQRSESTEPDVHTPKYASLDETAPKQKTMKCTLPPHKALIFNTYAEYDTHYQQNHTNRCSECGKNFPTAHFIELHITENHDPIAAAKRETGEKVYACFVEDCDKICSNWKKRRSHLVDKHGFPKNYDFLVVDQGIDHRRSMLRAGVDALGHRKSSRERQRAASDLTATSETTQNVDDMEAPFSNGMKETGVEASQPVGTGEGKKDYDGKKSAVDDLTSSFSSLKMVPRSVTFGQRRGRSGFSKK